MTNLLSEMLEFYEYAISQKGIKRLGVIVKEFNKKFGENLSVDTFSHRLAKYKKTNKIVGCKSMNYSNTEKIVEPHKDVFTQYADGAIEATQIIQMTKECFGNKVKMLTALGYDPREWQFYHLSWTSSDHYKSSGELGKTYYCVRYKVVPITNLTAENAFEIAKEYFDNNKSKLPVIKQSFPKQKNTTDKLIEIAPIELHLGKFANEIDSGDNYDHHVAEERFNTIINRVLEIQEVENTNKALVVIGSDFFNSEADGCTSINKIPQQNDTRYKKMFMIGLDLYTNALLKIREKFNSVDVMFCPGNHANAMEFFLYVALQQYFRVTDINFVEDYKDTQVYRFGNCALFFNHGDTNLKRLISSIPAEFYEIWGQTKYRELHLGHLHKEVTVDDESGMITRRIGSPSGTDNWHYHNRFVGATRKHQIFVWDKDYGLNTIHYINF